MEPHISQKFNAELKALVNHIIKLSDLVETQLQNILELLGSGDKAVYQQVIDNEEKVDNLEITIDKDCAQIIALRQPAASDLRLILSISRSVRDLERIGDEAYRVAEMIQYVHHKSKLHIGLTALRHIVGYVISDFQKTSKAFASFDVSSIMEIVRKNESIEEESQSATREMMTYMIEDPACISHVLKVLWAIRSLERISDHTCNIAEQLIYFVAGVDVRHASIKKMKKYLDQTEKQ